jgi:hypothetical protein
VGNARRASYAHEERLCITERGLWITYVDKCLCYVVSLSSATENNTVLDRGTEGCILAPLTNANTG